MKRVLVAVACFLMLCSVAYCGVVYYDDPLAVGLGARVIGMGRAFVAVADDTNAMFLNPAGLGSQKLLKISSMSTNFMDEFQYTMLSGVYPTSNGVFGIGYVGSHVGDILVSGGGTTSYANQALVLSYGKYVGDSLAGYLGGEHNILAGANLKYFSKGFSGDVQASGAGYNFDLGAKYIANDRTAFGINFQNILFASKIAGDIEPEDMPFVTRIGAAYYWRECNLLFAADKDMFVGRFVPWPMHLGVEWRAHENLILRAGLDQVAGSSGGGDISTNSTFGVGFQYNGFRVDVAYMQNFAETNISSSFISISFYGSALAFGKNAEEEMMAAKPAPPPPTPSPIISEAPEIPQKPITEKIILINPQDKTYTFDSEIAFIGGADPDVKEILINDKNVPFNPDRTFSEKIPLAYGQNTVKVLIRDISGNEGSISMNLARYYLPKDMTTREAESKYIDYVIIQSKVHDYLGKDYSADDYVSREALSVIISKIKELKKNKVE